MNHARFILSPCSEILKDVVSASSGIGIGIETFPLCDYVMQSVFLKMTGAQEQKMKCICWELATHDYEYRYDRFSRQPLGECSAYKDKKTIYMDLIKSIEKNQSSLSLANMVNTDRLIPDTMQIIEGTFKGTNLLIWAQKSFNEFVDIWQDFSSNHVASDKHALFTSRNHLSRNDPVKSKKDLAEIYEGHLYIQRNRIAHNTLSYQQNLPTLKALVEADYKYNNYFIYFAILILLDKVFIALFETYQQTREETSFV
ncbi:hypothetical protein [Thalassotalea montiporae]